MTTRMLIIDDEFYIRMGIRNAIDWSSIDVEIVGEAEDGERGLALALELKPDLILTDIRMPFLDGLELIKQLHSQSPSCGIIVLSGYDEFEYAQTAIKYGVLDYLLKPIDKAKLKETVQHACNTVRNRRSIQHYQNLMEQEQSTLRTQFLKDLLFRRVTDEALIQSKIKALNLPFHDCRYQAVSVKLDDYPLLERQFSAEELRSLKSFVESSLSECFSLGKTFTGILLEISLEEWAIILTYLNTASDSEKEKEIHSICQSLAKSVKEHSAHTISVSVGPLCDSLAELSDSYQNTRLSNKKYLPRTNSIVYADQPYLDHIRPEVQKALNFIRQHYNEDISIQQVADSLYLSPYYLMHIFKNDTGKTFHTFLTDYRMETAKELLKTPGCKVYEVAEKTGYTDVKYFNKLFKKYTSLTPSDYIRIHYAEV